MVLRLEFRLGVHLALVDEQVKRAIAFLVNLPTMGWMDYSTEEMVKRILYLRVLVPYINFLQIFLHRILWAIYRIQIQVVTIFWLVDILSHHLMMVIFLHILLCMNFKFFLFHVLSRE